jgi:hypothetical protein
MAKANSGYPTSAQVLEAYDAWEKDGVQGLAKVLGKREKEWAEAHPTDAALAKQAAAAAEAAQRAKTSPGTEMTPPPGE